MRDIPSKRFSYLLSMPWDFTPLKPDAKPVADRQARRSVGWRWNAESRNHPNRRGRVIPERTTSGIDRLSGSKRSRGSRRSLAALRSCSLRALSVDHMRAENFHYLCFGGARRVCYARCCKSAGDPYRARRRTPDAITSWTHNTAPVLSQKSGAS